MVLHDIELLVALFVECYWQVYMLSVIRRVHLLAEIRVSSVLFGFWMTLPAVPGSG